MSLRNAKAYSAGSVIGHETATKPFPVKVRSRSCSSLNDPARDSNTDKCRTFRPRLRAGEINNVGDNEEAKSVPASPSGQASACTSSGAPPVYNKSLGEASVVSSEPCSPREMPPAIGGEYSFVILQPFSRLILLRPHQG